MNLRILVCLMTFIVSPHQLLASAQSNGIAYATCTTVSLPTDWRCLQVQSGASWSSLFADESHRDQVMRYNR